MGTSWWALLFAIIAVGGLAALVLVGLRVWRSARGLLAELDTAAMRAGELADLLASVQVVAPADGTVRTADGPRSEVPSDDGWPGTVESYDDRGADASGKKES